MNDTLQRLLDSLNKKIYELPTPQKVNLPEFPPLPIPLLTVQEKIWYNYIPVILKGVSILLRGTVAANAAELLISIKGDVMPSAITDSPKSTAVGILGLIAVLASTISMLVDGDPLTNPDFAVVIPAIIGNIGMIFANFGKPK